MKVNYDEALRWLEYKRNVNTCSIEEIEWVRDDGSKVEVDPEYINDFKITGLSNLCFAECFIWHIVNGTEAELKR
jgi:hypothetical protein